VGSETRLTRASAESLLETCADAIPLLRELDDARASSLIRQLEDLQDELRAQLLAGQITPGGPSGVVGVDWAAAPLREGD
jgi:hypothetical protein